MLETKCSFEEVDVIIAMCIKTMRKCVDSLWLLSNGEKKMKESSPEMMVEVAFKQ